MDAITLNRQQRAVYNFLKEHSAGQTRLQIAYGTGIVYFIEFVTLK